MRFHITRGYKINADELQKWIMELMIIDCISDLHGHYPKLEGGDLLIVGGDLTARDTLEGYMDFDSWLQDQDYRCKILIGGNHDNLIQNKGWEKLTEPFSDLCCDYICDFGTEFEGLKIWGSPWTLRFEGMNPHCMAFTVDTEEELAEKWAMIPDDVDILVTHSPPKGMLDKTIDGTPAGSQSLTNKIHRLQPLLHVFGHIHESYGKEDYFIPATKYIGVVGCHFVNASHVNERYQPVNKPIRITL
jgi:hypothetical protein